MIKVKIPIPCIWASDGVVYQEIYFDTNAITTAQLVEFLHKQVWGSECEKQIVAKMIDSVRNCQQINFTKAGISRAEYTVNIDHIGARTLTVSRIIAHKL